jgi:hypothetical protein
MNSRTRQAGGLSVALLLLALLQVTLGLPAMATSAPKRPHPHRKPWPITLTVQTVPALPGLRFRLDDTLMTADAHGRVRFTEEHNFSPHTLRLLDTALEQSDRRLRFIRWAGQRDPNQAFSSTVTGLPMRMSYTVTAAFAVQIPVVTRLVNGAGTPVEPSRVSSVSSSALPASKSPESADSSEARVKYV